MFNFSKQGLEGQYAEDLPSAEKMREERERAKTALSSNVGPRFKREIEMNQPVILKKTHKKYDAPEKRIFFMGAGDQAEAEISKEDFEQFIDKGTASEKVIQILADKIATGRQMNPEEIAIYSEHSSAIEERLKNKQMKQS